jgi:phytoene dehydrogenase-like protein
MRCGRRLSLTDVVVVGAGHNGLVAANLLADAGWEVQVFEATDQSGGSVRTAELTVPGSATTCSAPSTRSGWPRRSWPVAAGGLRPGVGARPLVVAHPHADGRCAVLSRDLAKTAAAPAAALAAARPGYPGTTE